MPNAAQQPTKSNLRPFRMGTRQRVTQFGTAPIAIGSQVTTELPRVGFLHGIVLNVSAVVNLGGAGALSATGPWSLFKRIKVNLNTGAASVFDCSGFGAFIVNSRMMRTSYNPALADVFQAPVANGNNTWSFSLYVPISINNGQQFALGMINLQAPELRCTVDLTFAPAGADFVSNFNTITGNVSLSYMYYEVPNPMTTAYPPLTLHRILEDRQLIQAAGDQTYVFPRGGTVLGLYHVVTLNGTIADLRQGLGNSNSIDNVRLVLNKTDTLYNVPARAQAVIQMKNNPSGVGQAIEWNFLDAGVTGTGEGDFRDTINSEALSTLESIITVNGAAVIGATAFFDSIRRIYQQLQA